jgi:hypothetical protein
MYQKTGYIILKGTIRIIMAYKLSVYGVNYRLKNKDDVIAQLMLIINGDGVNAVKLVFPDESFIEYEGDE